MRRRRGPGLLGTALVVGAASNAGARSAQRSHAAAQQQADQSAQLAELQAQQAAAAAPAGPDPVVEIQKFAALRDQGVLTEEEFSAKKKQILGI
jgi:hypothetical protein